MIKHNRETKQKNTTIEYTGIEITVKDYSGRENQMNPTLKKYHSSNETVSERKKAIKGDRKNSNTKKRVNGQIMSPLKGTFTCHPGMRENNVFVECGLSLPTVASLKGQPPSTM